MALDTLPFSGAGLLLVFKIAFIILSLLYFFFSLIVVRQVKLMTETLVTAISPILRTFSILHALTALGLVIFFVFF